MKPDTFLILAFCVACVGMLAALAIGFGAPIVGLRRKTLPPVYTPLPTFTAADLEREGQRVEAILETKKLRQQVRALEVDVRCYESDRDEQRRRANVMVRERDRLRKGINDALLFLESLVDVDEREQRELLGTKIRGFLEAAMLDTKDERPPWFPKAETNARILAGDPHRPKPPANRVEGLPIDDRIPMPEKKPPNVTDELWRDAQPGIGLAAVAVGLATAALAEATDRQIIGHASTEHATSAPAVEHHHAMPAHDPSPSYDSGSSFDSSSSDAGGSGSSGDF